MLATRRARFSGPALPAPESSTVTKTQLPAPSPLSQGRIPAQSTRHHTMAIGEELVEAALSQNVQHGAATGIHSTVAFVDTPDGTNALGKLVASLEMIAKQQHRQQSIDAPADADQRPSAFHIAQIRQTLLQSSSFVDLDSEPFSAN